MCAAQVADDYAEKTWRVKFDQESLVAEAEAAKEAEPQSLEDKAIAAIHWVMDSAVMAPVRSTIEVPTALALLTQAFASRKRHVCG